MKAFPILETVRRVARRAESDHRATDQCGQSNQDDDDDRDDHND